MKAYLAPSYSDFFDEEIPTYNNLMKDIPSWHTIGLMSTLNNALLSRGDTMDTQLYLFGALTINVPIMERDRLVQKLKVFINKAEGVFALFASRYIVDVVNRELIDFKKDIKQSYSNDDELKIFKAYLLVVGEINEVDSELLLKAIEESKVNNKYPFQRTIWPVLIRQFEFTNPPDVIYESVKAFSFFQYLERHAEFKIYLDAFLKAHGCASSLQYVASIMDIVTFNFNAANNINNPGDYYSRIRVTEDYPLFELLAVDADEIKNNPSKQQDYIGLKEKPLFKIKHNEYIVPYFHFLYKNIFTGLVFSFYRNSGVNKICKTFPDFKTTIGNEYSEKILFRNLIKKCLTKKHSVLKYFDSNEEFNPDYYYRNGNNIFIIEFKDYLLAANTIQSGSFDTIKKAIDEKFIKNPEKGKGITQLSKLIAYISKEDLQFDNIFAKQKRRNITIYPIIVHTNFYFEFPGINDYLASEFQIQIEALKNKFKSIKPLTLINLQFFFNNLLLFRDHKLQLDGLIDKFIRITDKRKKETVGKSDVNYLINAVTSFEEKTAGAGDDFRFYKRNEYLGEVYDCLEIPRSELKTRI